MNYDCKIIQFKEEYITLRTMDMHIQQCTMLEGDSKDRLSIEYGVNSRSCLLDLETFDIGNGTLLPDVMHYILECVLQHVLQ